MRDIDPIRVSTNEDIEGITDEEIRASRRSCYA